MRSHEVKLMLIAAVLIFFAVAFRELSASLMIWNFVPMGAVALYAGARLPRRFAWLVPVLAMALSDVLIGDGSTSRPFFEWTRWTIYATFAAITLLGPLANLPRMGRWILPILPVASSLTFFVTSNLATWADGQIYPRTVEGLGECFWMALPFLKNTILSDMLGTALLFAVGPLVQRAFEGRWPAQGRGPGKLAEIPIEANPSDRHRSV
jgi:Family of unknown function (DUF6580)